MFMKSFDRDGQVTHICPIKTGAGGLISEDWCIDTFAERLAALPDDLSAEQIIRRRDEVRHLHRSETLMTLGSPRL
jgi:hypothetical protein